MNILFVCDWNSCRSPTAKLMWDGQNNIIAKSAGAKFDLTKELVTWADIVITMEESQLEKLSHMSETKRVYCLDIPDEYYYTEKSLMDLLDRKLTSYLGPPRSFTDGEIKKEYNKWLNLIEGKDT